MDDVIFISLYDSRYGCYCIVIDVNSCYHYCDIDPSFLPLLLFLLTD